MSHESSVSLEYSRMPGTIDYTSTSRKQQVTKNNNNNGVELDAYQMVGTLFSLTSTMHIKNQFLQRCRSCSYP